MLLIKLDMPSYIWHMLRYSCLQKLCTHIPTHKNTHTYIIYPHTDTQAHIPTHTHILTHRHEGNRPESYHTISNDPVLLA